MVRLQSQCEKLPQYNCYQICSKSALHHSHVHAGLRRCAVAPLGLWCVIFFRGLTPPVYLLSPLCNWGMAGKKSQARRVKSRESEERLDSRVRGNDGFRAAGRFFAALRMTMGHRSRGSCCYSGFAIGGAGFASVGGVGAGLGSSTPVIRRAERSNVK